SSHFNDLIYTDAVVSAMKTKMPIGSEVKVFENAGHFLHREVFPAYIKALKQFLSLSNGQ
ncbi:MAG: alpha/beta hydrolase, partial [Bacteroidota bacterium]